MTSKTRTKKFVFDPPIIIKGGETVGDGESLSVSYTVSTKAGLRIDKMGKTEKSYAKNLPPRLEAWDAAEEASGWAVSVDDLRKWAEAVLAESESNPGEAVKYIEELVKHLK